MHTEGTTEQEQSGPHETRPNQSLLSNIFVRSEHNHVKKQHVLHDYFFESRQLTVTSEVPVRSHEIVQHILNPL